MPGVFKALRVEAIRSHRVVRYLGYAVGEVLLIFIGITLAIAFDNMNEQRRTEGLERQILAVISRNLEANVQELDRNIADDEGSISSMDPVLENLTSGAPWNDALSTSLDRAVRWSSPYFSTSGYESLKQLGLHLVSDPQLRDELVYLFETTYAILLGDHDKAHWSFYETVMLPVRNRHLEQFDPEGDARRHFRPAPDLGAAGRRELLNMLQSHRYRLFESLDVRRDARADTQKMIESIEHFLGGDN